MSKENFRRGFVLVLTLASAAAFIALMKGFFEAILLAGVFASIAYPLYRRLNVALRGRSTLAALTTLAIVFMAVVVPLIGLLGLIADQAMGIAEGARPWLESQLGRSSDGRAWLPEWVPYVDRLEPYRASIMEKLAAFASKAGSYFASSLVKITQETAVLMLNVFIMLYAMFVFLLNGPRLVKGAMGFVPLSDSDREKVIEVAVSVSRATIKGTLVIGVVQGVVGGLGLAVAGIEAAAFWGAVMGVLSVVPGVGTSLVWVPAVIYLFASGNTTAGLGLLIWCAGVVGSVDNFLRPFLVGRDTRMPDLLILLSTLGGLAWFGASGLVLGPIIAALFLTVLAIYRRVFADWLQTERGEQ